MDQTLTLPVPARRARRGSTAVRLRRGALAVRAALVLGVVGVLAMWWLSVPVGFGATPANAATSVGELSGMAGAFLVCAQVLLIARVPWFERAVGLDRLVSWHRSLGASVLFLVIAHVVFIVIGGELADRNPPWTEFVTVLQTYPDMITALVGTIAFLAVGLSSARLVRRRLSYEVWYWLHVTTYAAIFLTFFHQLSGGAHFVSDPVNRVLWIALYLGTAAAVLTWRFLLPGLDAWRGRMRVAAVVPEGHGMTSVWLTGPHVERMDVRAGNFLLFRFLRWGHLGTAHPYSVSAVPRDGSLRITVGALGDHSGRLPLLRPGTLVFAEGPFGHFTADTASRPRILLVAGGAGIGPIRALAEELASRGAQPVVLYRVSGREQLALLGELQAMPGVAVVPLVGRRADLGFDPLGPGSLSRIIPDLHDWEAFICGPEGMASQVERSLRELRMPKRYIHREELSMS
ncbi:ferredoxin reductase family protein [Leifsonia sp. F6_8S_P_1B]|uniref:Ferredoxin reductase family protein n=1 Tax=Leifsonia williamsii TaxID=3035919 RepID=A0ABT8K744_9MICO|nr:ferredoxin reductase family protein [Leifsonia williamsii]MDN4612838.1 ferredoxin reductase family protein [Leifsonia williamsii]